VQTGQTKKITLDRGPQQITAKARQTLNEMVGSGKLVPEKAEPDPSEQLITAAGKLMSKLPPDKQREISELLAKMAQARNSSDTKALGAHTATLTMFLMRFKA